jgi:hypothetical protein
MVLWREIAARGRRPAARRRRPRLECGSKGAGCGDGGSTSRIERGRNEFHRNALRGIVKQGAIWSSGSNRANRTDSGAPQLTLVRPLDTPRPAAPAPAQARPRSCRRQATLAPALVGDGVTHSSLKNAGRTDVAPSVWSGSGEVGVLAERPTNPSSGNDFVRVQDQGILLDHQRIPAE